MEQSRDCGGCAPKMLADFRQRFALPVMAHHRLALSFRQCRQCLGETQYLFVAQEGGRFEPRRVKLGARGDGDVEILDGVQEGETVVTTANFLIDSESRLRAAIEGQASGGAAGQGSAPPRPAAGGICAEFDGQKYPDKLAACRACEVQHRGMGSMVDDCKNAIPRPWR